MAERRTKKENPFSTDIGELDADNAFGAVSTRKTKSEDPFSTDIGEMDMDSVGRYQAIARDASHKEMGQQFPQSLIESVDLSLMDRRELMKGMAAQGQQQQQGKAHPISQKAYFSGQAESQVPALNEIGVDKQADRDNTNRLIHANQPGSNDGRAPKKQQQHSAIPVTRSTPTPSAG